MIDLVALHHVLDDYFSLEELKQLCFELGVDADDLEAIGQRGKARELIKWLEREQRVESLITLVEQKRPSLDLTHLHISSYQDRLRPAPPGSSISHYRGGAPHWAVLSPAGTIRSKSTSFAIPADSVPLIWRRKAATPSSSPAR